MHVVASELKNGHTRQDDVTARIPATIGPAGEAGQELQEPRRPVPQEVFEQGTAQLRHLNAVTVRSGEVDSIRADIVSYCARADRAADVGR